VWLPDRAYETPELKQGLCAELIDGSYACQASDQLWQMYTRSRPRLIGKCTKGAQVWRVLPGPRTDQARLARNDSTLEKWWLVEPPKRLAAIDLPWISNPWLCCVHTGTSEHPVAPALPPVPGLPPVPAPPPAPVAPPVAAVVPTFDEPPVALVCLGLHVLSHSCCVSKLLALPPQPP